MSFQSLQKSHWDMDHSTSSARLLLGEMSAPKGLSLQDRVNPVKPLQVSDYAKNQVFL